MQHPLLDRDMAGPHVEQRVESGLVRTAGPPRMRLIGRSVGIDDEVHAGPVDLQAAQPNARTEEVAHAHVHAQALDLCVRRLAGIFQAVNHQPVRLGFEMEQAPMKGCDLDPAAGEVFDVRDQALANHVLECGRAGDEIEPKRQERQQNHRASHCQRQMSQKEAPQTAAHPAPGRLGRDGWFAADGRRFAFAHRPPFPRRLEATGVSGAGARADAGDGVRSGSSTSTSPCWRRLLSQVSNSMLTCCSSRIS